MRWVTGVDQLFFLSLRWIKYQKNHEYQIWLVSATESSTSLMRVNYGKKSNCRAYFSYLKCKYKCHFFREVAWGIFLSKDIKSFPTFWLVESYKKNLKSTPYIATKVFFNKFLLQTIVLEAVKIDFDDLRCTRYTL